MLAFIWLAHFSLTLNFVTENFGGHSTIGDSNVLNSLDSLNFM
jgi:hypothetical protein